MSVRYAQCACGSVAITTAHGAQPLVVTCHCQACQRQTGAPFGAIAYFAAHQLEIGGTTSAFTRIAASGRQFTSHFCVACGTPMWFEAEGKPGMLGVSVGAFADPDFPPPFRSVWEETRHSWVTVGPDIEHFAQGSTR